MDLVFIFSCLRCSEVPSLISTDGKRFSSFLRFSFNSACGSLCKHTHTAIPEARTRSVCVKRRREDNVSANGQRCSLHLAAQNRITYDSGRLSNLLQDFVQSLNAAHHRPFLHVCQLGDLRKGLSHTQTHTHHALIYYCNAMHCLYLLMCSSLISPQAW